MLHLLLEFFHPHSLLCLLFLNLSQRYSVLLDYDLVVTREPIQVKFNLRVSLSRNILLQLAQSRVAPNARLQCLERRICELPLIIHSGVDGLKGQLGLLAIVLDYAVDLLLELLNL